MSEVNVYPEPPSSDLIDRKVKERQHQAILREKNEKIDAILQRRRYTPQHLNLVCL